MRFRFLASIFVFFSFPIPSPAVPLQSQSNAIRTKADVVAYVEGIDSWHIVKPVPDADANTPVLSQHQFAQLMSHLVTKRDVAVVILGKQLSIDTPWRELVGNIEPFLRFLGCRRIVFLQATAATPDGDLPVLHDTTDDRLRFNTFISECENRWVVLPPKNASDTLHVCGFVYIDAEAGFTFHMGTFFHTEEDGRLRPEPKGDLANIMLKNRIEQDSLVAVLTANDIEQLNLSATPDWLEFYKSDPDTLHHKIRWGWAYNHIGAPAKALAFVEPAYEQAPDDKKVLFELTYAYNALRRTEDATRVLRRALADNPNDFFLNREYAYTLSHSGRWNEAIGQYQHCIKICPDNEMSQKSEAAFNLALCYSQTADQKDADKWFALAKKWAPEGSPVYLHFKQMERSK
jgi:Tfp pilus assembly protein PilF